MHVAEDKPEIRRAGHTSSPPAARTIIQWKLARVVSLKVPMLTHVSCLHLLCLFALACQSHLKKLAVAKGGLFYFLQTRTPRSMVCHGQGNRHPDSNRSGHALCVFTGSGGLTLQVDSTLALNAGLAPARCSKRKGADKQPLQHDARDILASPPCVTKEEALASCKHKEVIGLPPSHAWPIILNRCPR